MASTFFAVFNQSEDQGGYALGAKGGKEGKIVESVKAANFVKLEAESVADAQLTLRELFPGRNTTTAIVVTEAQWKSS